MDSSIDELEEEGSLDLASLVPRSGRATSLPSLGAAPQRAPESRPSAPALSRATGTTRTPDENSLSAFHSRVYQLQRDMFSKDVRDKLEMGRKISEAFALEHVRVA